MIREPQPTTFGAQTAGRAFHLLQAIVASARPLTLNELAAEVGLTKSAAYRLTREMEEQSLVTINDDRGYVPGPGLYALAARVMGRLDLRLVARPYLLRISEQTGETIGLHLRHGMNRVCVDIVDGIHPVRRFLTYGETHRLTVGPSGKSILAFLPERESILAGLDPADATRIRAQLEGVRQNGFMAAVGDQNAGVSGLSVPVFGFDGVIAAVTVSGPSDRWSLDAMLAAAPRVAAEMRECSRSLGARDADLLWGVRA